MSLWTVFDLRTQTQGVWRKAWMVLSLLVFMGAGVQAATINVPADYATISLAVAAASPGDVIVVAPGTYTEQINLNKSLTIDGGNKNTTTIQGDITFPLLGGGRYFMLISGGGAGSTIKNITFNKTDKTGEQNMIGLQAANVTFDDCNFTGQYVLGDPDVSRAFEVSGSSTNFLIQDCSITNLRQPAYFNPGSSGSVTNCYVHNTRGWVVDGATVTFSGNTFGTNAVDIALLAGTALGAPYDPLSTLSANNDGAIFSDQRVYVAYNVTQNTNHGTIQAAVNAANSGDLIQVAPGTHAENVSITQSVTINGPNAGVAGNGTRGTEAIISNGGFSVLGAYTVVIDGFRVLNTNDTDPITFSGSATATIQNCIIERNGVNAGVGIRAITFQAGGSAAKMVKNNKFTGDVSGGLFSSHKTWNSALYVNTTTSTITVQDNVFQNCRTAINFDDIINYGATLTVVGNTFDNNGTHVSIGGTVAQTGSYTWGANEFKTPGSAIFNLSNVATSFRLDITAGTFNGTAFNALSLATLFGVEAGMYHRGRSSRNGLVTYVANNQYVIPVNPSIQLAIDYAVAGHIINIADSTYNQRLTVNKSLTLDGQSEAGTILTGTGLPGVGSGITINNAITGVTIKDMTVQNFAGSGPNSYAGIYAVGGNNNLMVENAKLANNVGGSGFYANGPVDNVTLNNLEVFGHTNVAGAARGIVIWNGLKSNITITNCDVYNNNCCGIELQDGTATGVTMSNNNVYDNGDNGIGIVGMQGPGANLISVNTLTNNGRFGMEIKNPNGNGANSGAGSIVVQNNTVTRTNPIGAEVRDIAGIAVMRRGVLAGNVDVPTGVVVTGNTVSGYVQPSTSDGFGIVIGGFNHTVTGNTVTGNDVGIQQQAGHIPYPGDGDQNNLADQYFGRDNSPMTCSNNVSGNTLSGNTVNTRNISVGGGLVTNTNTSEVFCSIQSAIDDAQTLNGHTLSVAAGTHLGDVTINKSLTLNGPNAGTSGCATRVAEAVIQGSFTIGTDGITIDGFEFTGANAQIASTSGATVRSNITIVNNYLHATTAQIPIRHGLGLGGGIGSANWTVSNNKIDDIQLNAATAIALFNINSVFIQNNCITHTNASFTGRRGINADGLQTATISGNTLNLGDAYPSGTTNTPWAIQISMSDRDATGITMTGNTISNTFYGVVGLSQRNLTGLNATCNILTGVARGFTFNSGSVVPVFMMPLMSNITIKNNDISSSDRCIFFRNLHSADPNGPVKYNNLTVEENKLVRTTAGAAIDTDGSTINDGQVKAEKNWYGSAPYASVLARNVGAIDFVPYQVNSDDLDLVTSCFAPDPLATLGGPVQVYNGNTLVSGHALIQEAIDAGTTLSGYTVRIATGTYPGNVDAVTGGKNLRFAPGASPGCVTITGDLTLNSGDILEIEIDGTTPCTQHDQFTVTGTVTLGGATITVPAGMFVPVSGDLITIINNTGASAVSGKFAQGNFVTDGTSNYYINYIGGDNNDVVLSKCCGALLDIGLFNHVAPTPVGSKLRVFVKPNNDVINGTYSNGVFTIRTLSSNSVTFSSVTSPFGYALVAPVLTNGGYDYFRFYFEAFPTVNWTKDTEYELLTLVYACTGNATFELIDDAFADSNGGAFYQELGAADATGIFYQATATSPVSVSITATSNSPVCETMNIDLNSTTSNGTNPYTYAWDGPNTYSSALGDPVPFVAVLASAGVYTVTVTDNNGCTASATTTVVVPASGACVKNVDLTTYYPTITQAINVPETLNGHTLEVPPGNWYEVVNVTKGLTIKGNNDGIDCDGSRVAESIINAGAATAVTISANGVTIDGFQIEGGTGVSSTGFTDAAIINNKVNAFALGIGATGVATTGSDGYGIDQNCIDLAAQAYEAFTFDNAPVLSATQAPGVWYTDRYAPKGFTNATFGGGIRLKHSIDATDCQSCRPGGFNTAFYNTQGRKYDITGAKAMTIQVYIPSDWATTGRRMAGFWGSATNGITPAITAYPILEFTSDGSNPRFRGWNNGVWVDMGLPAGFAYDQWYTLGIAISGSNIIYTVGNLETVVPGLGSAQLANVILQGHNTDTPGVTYDIYWDNLSTFTSPAATFNTPTVGVALTVASGTQAVVVEDNNVSDAFYGYVLAGVTTTPRTTVRGGTYSNLLQGVAVVNTLDGVTYVPSTVGVADLSFTSFAGSHPLIPAANFHAGVYAFTGGANPAAVVDVLVDNVIVKKTGKTSQASAGLYFADFSAGAGNRLNAVVMNSEIDSNLNRGVQVRGVNATALVHNNEIRYNGADPFGAGGNDGFGIIVNNGAALTLNNNTITNPPTQAGIYPVTAMFIGVAPAGSITAFENSINRNGNGSLTGNTYPIAQFTATCNWWQSASIDVVDGLVDGNVLFVPYLNNGTDTDAGARGFVPTPGSCVNPKRWYVNDNALTDDVFTLGLGDDLNQGTKRRPFRTISKAVLTAVSADTVYADAGSYNEQVVVPSTKNNMHIVGVGPCNAVAPALTTMVDFTGTVSGKPTLFDIAGDGTVIDGIHFKADLTKLSSAIIASHSALDIITIKNNCIDPYQSTPGTYLAGYGNRNAISINYNGGINYRTAAGGVNNIIVDNNRVTATVNGAILGDDAGDISFRSAVSVDEGAGTYTRNTFQSINHDVLVRFNGNGPVVIGGSVPNANTFLGGGVQYSDPNAGGGAVTISHNAFDGSVSGSVLRLQNNYHNAAVSVANNTLSNVRWGMSLENFRNVSVTDNVLSPLAGFANFRLITVNTKSISSNSASIVQVPINGTFTGNTFNAGAPGTGTAMAFYNHDSDMATLNTGAFTVGMVGSPNVFAPGFLYAVYLGDQTGNTFPAPVDFPEYGPPGFGAGSNTIMACWDLDINIEKNTFNVGSGAQYPQFMNHAQRLALEAILWHLPDNPCLGELIYFVPVELYAKVFLQGPYDSASGLMNDNLRNLALIPADTPYDTLNTMSFPGSFNKINNFVTETVNPTVFTTTGPNAIVDWVWLELRDPGNNSTVLATRSALVQRDGDIVDLDGTSAVLFPDSYEGPYYVYVRHRNHLGAMTSATVDLAAAHLVDFTSASTSTFGSTSTSARKLIKTATYGLIAGNTLVKDGVGFRVYYNGSGNDRAPILNIVGPSTPLATVSSVYKLEDVNMDGNVRYNGSGNDRVIILNNVGASTPLVIITQQPNN